MSLYLSRYAKYKDEPRDESREFALNSSRDQDLEEGIVWSCRKP